MRAPFLTRFSSAAFAVSSSSSSSSSSPAAVGGWRRERASSAAAAVAAAQKHYALVVLVKYVSLDVRHLQKQFESKRLFAVLPSDTLLAFVVAIHTD